MVPLSGWNSYLGRCCGEDRNTPSGIGWGPCAPIRVLTASAPPLSAQFWARLANQSVEVAVLHPPELGLKVSRVALAPSRNPASTELADALTVDLLHQRELEVVGKGDVDPLDRAQEMAARGAVDPALVAQRKFDVPVDVLLRRSQTTTALARRKSLKKQECEPSGITASRWISTFFLTGTCIGRINKQESTHANTLERHLRPPRSHFLTPIPAQYPGTSHPSHQNAAF